jgi:hypothetical protein
VKVATVREEIARQLASNAKTLPYFESFREHRERQTSLVALGKPPVSGGPADVSREGSSDEARPTRELCVLGAGNCFDLDLEKLAADYERIHLVDVDRQAVEGARARLSRATQRRLVLHAPVDLSGCNSALERWRDLKANPSELIAVPGRVSEELSKRFPTRFHTVLSACLLSQLLHTARRVLGETHPLFEAASLVLTLAHLRALVRLARPGGRAFLVTDVSSSEIVDLPRASPGIDQRSLLERLCATGQVFRATAPSTIRGLVRDDPTLSREATLSDPLDAWVWQLGKERAFLVTAFRLEPTS